MLRDDANVISHAGGRQEEIGYLQTYWWRKNVALDLRVDGGGTSSFGAADETDKSIGSPSHQLPFRANRWKDGRTRTRGRTRMGYSRTFAEDRIDFLARGRRPRWGS